MWYPGLKTVSSAMFLNLSQLHPKIPICLVINFQHPSDVSICHGWPNCLRLLPTCATQAARNVALYVFSTTACTVGPRSAEHLGPRPLICRMTVVLVCEGGLIITGNFTTPPPLDGCKMLGLWTFCLTTPPPSGCLCFCTPGSLPPESFTKPPLVQPLWHLWSQEST